jgi:hypothetical protein
MNAKTALVISRGFLVSAAALPKEVKSSLIKTLTLLVEDVRHPSLQCKKVNGARASVYECRVDQKVRLIYDVKGDTIRCWYVGLHDVALRFATKYSPATEFLVDDIQVQDIPFEIRPVIAFLIDGRTEPEFDSIALQTLVARLLGSKS